MGRSRAPKNANRDFDDRDNTTLYPNHAQVREDGRVYEHLSENFLLHVLRYG